MVKFWLLYGIIYLEHLRSNLQQLLLGNHMAVHMGAVAAVVLLALAAVVLHPVVAVVVAAGDHLESLHQAAQSEI